jgi:hypothetical protein
MPTGDFAGKSGLLHVPHPVLTVRFFIWNQIVKTVKLFLKLACD